MNHATAFRYFEKKLLKEKNPSAMQMSFKILAKGFSLENYKDKAMNMGAPIGA